MLLVADSGSSKADWVLMLSNTERITFRTNGINPFFLSEKDIIKIFQNTPEILPYTDKVKPFKVYFDKVVYSYKANKSDKDTTKIKKIYLWDNYQILNLI